MHFIIITVLCFFIGCASYNNPCTNEIDFKGHHYIVFSVPGNYGQTYVHDPDCKCYNRFKLKNKE